MIVSPIALVDGLAFVGSNVIARSTHAVATSLDATLSDISAVASLWYPAGSSVADALLYGSTVTIAQEFDSIVAFGHVIVDLSTNIFNEAQSSLLYGMGRTLGASSRAFAVFDTTAGISGFVMQSTALQSASILDTFRSAAASVLAGLAQSIAPSVYVATPDEDIALPVLEQPAVISLPQ